jgi:predicted DNA-binding protein (UPF0251 family)
VVQRLSKAVRGRGGKSREALLRRMESHLDTVYDLIQQCVEDETTSLQVLELTLKKAQTRSRKENYEKYMRLWVLRLTVESIQRLYPRFLSEQLPGQVVPFASLNLEEKLALLLTERVGLSATETASVLQMQVGRVGRSLTYAREKVAKDKLGLEVNTNFTLRERILWNQSGEGNASYIGALSQVSSYVRDLESHQFVEIERSVRQNKLLPILGKPEFVRWRDLSWQYKLGLEASLLGVVGLFAVVVLPWALSQVNFSAFAEGRFSEVFQVNSVAQEPVVMKEITAERLLASTDTADIETLESAEDEFANVEFPSGDSYEVGTAPLAPSRQAAAVYRLIVQSTSPRDLIPEVRNLFAKRNVREREGSGRMMPGGVYFDGITSVGNYPSLVQEIRALGLEAKTYSNPGASKNPNERARVIVWVQQI